MAASDIDQKILGRIAKETALQNSLLSQAFYQVLGLSVILARKLYKARKKLNNADDNDARTTTLQHQIIWLSREGLAITEVYILPYCQDETQLPRARVMAAKLRASFLHVFCLFHNYPPVSQLTPPKNSPNTKTTAALLPTTAQSQSTRDVRARQAVLRETIPSMMSDASYVTNPYALTGPAMSSPPPYPLPPIPRAATDAPSTPVRPILMGVRSPLTRSPPSPADYIMPKSNFVPAAASCFSHVTALASRLLPGSDPLRLSVTFESCAFAWECGKDFALAKDRARIGVRDAHAAPEAMDDSDFKDASLLVAAMKAIASRTEKLLPAKSVSAGKSARSSPSSDTATGPTKRAASHLSSASASPSRRPRRPRSRRSKTSQQSQASAEELEVVPAQVPPVENDQGLAGPVQVTAGLAPATTTASDPSKAAPSASTATASKPPVRRQRRGSSRSQQSASPASSVQSEKERKRRIMEEAEQKLLRRSPQIPPRTTSNK